MASVVGLKRRLDNIIRKHEEKIKTAHVPTPFMLYDPEGIRESTWINGPPPENFDGAIFYLPYNDRDD